MSCDILSPSPVKMTAMVESDTTRIQEITCLGLIYIAIASGGHDIFSLITRVGKPVARLSNAPKWGYVAPRGIQ